MRRTFILILAVISLASLSVAVFAQDDIKQRMIDRKPTIDKMKEKGVIGENNKGYLEFVGNARESEDVINAENADRRTVYQAIAKKNNESIEVVQKGRAVQIAERAKAGEWLQDENGKWHKK